MKLAELTVHNFLDLLASSAPAPGGGSVAALNLALGASLVEMVCALTIGRKKYAEAEETMLLLQKQACELRSQAEDLIQDDTDAYDAVMAAYALPREDATEQKVRREAILQATRGAIQVPQKTAQQSLRLGEMALKALRLGNSNAASDALVAAYLADSAAKAALANVRINLGGLRDEAEITAYEAEIERITVGLERLGEQAALLSKVHLG